MKLAEAFPGNWLKSADLGEEDHLVTIKEVRSEVVGQGADKQLKLVVEFEELDKALICNKTNATTIAKMYGDETDDWLGKKITLWVNPDVQFGSDIVSAIRVRSRRPDVATRGPAAIQSNAMSYSEAVRFCEDHGISANDMKAYLKSCGQMAYDAAKCSPLVRHYVAGMGVPASDDEPVPF